MADTQSDSASYTDSTVESETTYHYGVLALSQDGNSVQSGAISATTPEAPSSGEQDDPREAPKKEDPPERAGPRQVDTTPPTVSSAQTSTDGSQIQITLSEALLTTTNPPLNSAFEVTTDAEPHATSGTVTVSTTMASFTVSPSISQGQAVVVTYTDPTTNNDVARVLQDAAGNDVATFTTGVAGVPAVNNLSTTAATAPGAPTSLTATASGSSRINLSWTAPADNGGRNITSYKIEVSSDGGNAWTDRVATTGDNNRTYAHTGLSAGSTRHYRVSAINSIGTSSASNVNGATTNNPPTAMNGAVTVDEDKIFYFRFRPDLLGYSHPNGNSMDSFTITEMPARGELTMSGWQINNLPFRIHSKSVQNRGRYLRYKPAPNGHGTPYATFKFKVNDGTEDSTAEYTMTINVTPVNDPAYGQVFITGTTQMGYSLTAFTSAIGDRDGIPRDQLNYQWKRYAANGTTFETNIGVNSSTYRVTDNDVGKKIKLEVRFTDNEGTDEGPLTSPAFPYIATQTVGEATFISTIGMAGDSSRSFTTQEQGQVFTTGGHPNGYTVTSVVIISEDAGGDDVALKICEVDGSLHPTAVCTDLTAPGASLAGPLVFTAPPGTMLTGGRTNYMVVFDSPGDDEVLLDAHVSDGYGSNSLAGFSIRNRIHYKTGSGWQELSYRQGIRMAVLGTINP